MDKDTILDYVTETPGNTNRAVLGSMLDSIEGGGGSEVLVVHFKNSEDSVSPFVDYICDTEITVIQEALDNGTPVIGFVEAWMSGTKNAELTVNVSFEIGSYVSRIELFQGKLVKNGISGWSDLYTWQCQSNS